MTVAADFPTLSRLVLARTGSDLDTLAKPRAGEFRLDSVVDAYARNPAPIKEVPDPTGYLVTLERFAKSLTTSEGEKLGIKLCNLNHPSMFLDTIGEAALAEWYRARGELHGVEVPLGNGKDADVVATVHGSTFWIDVLSVVGAGPEYLDAAPPKERDWNTATADELSEALPDGSSLILWPALVFERLKSSAASKYQTKFADAAAGPRKGENLVVALCLVHREERLPFLHLIGAPDDAWFQSMPGLASVLVFTVRKTQLSDMLLPIPLAQWNAPANEVLLLGK